MKGFKLLALAALALVVSGCATRTGDRTLAEYCAVERNQNHDLCKVHRDIEGTRTTLGDRIQNVLGVANRAQTTADQALAREDQMTCVTRTLRNTAEGTCDAGYQLTGCTQTRFTYRAGGMSIMREINDTRCRYQGQVLEMQVRCCHVGASPPPATMTDVAPLPLPGERRTRPAVRPAA
jgi:hypothetical protein